MSSLAAGFALGMATTAIGAATLGSSIFSDVKAGSYYDDAVGEMYSLGIIKGYEGTGKFGPDDVVTRGQLAVMLQRLRAEMTGDVISAGGSSSTRSKASSSSSSSAASANSVGSNRFGFFRFTTASVTITEGVPKLVLSVIRTSGDDDAVKVDYETTGGNASDGSDYEKTSGTLEFAEGETGKNITIILKDDTDSEGNETFEVKLGDTEGGAALGNPSTVTVTIKDNESGGSAASGASSTSTNSAASTASSGPSISFGATSYSVREGSGSIAITVVRSGPTSNAANVNYATSNGTAGSSNYTATNGTLSFAANETSKTFTVTVTNNSSIDGNKTVKLTLSSPTGGSTLVVSAADLTIVDDEIAGTYGYGVLKVSKENLTISEGGKATLSVLRTAGAFGTVTVQYRTNNLTAIAGHDFTGVTGTMTFAPGETAKNIDIFVLKDNEADGGEAFEFEIFSVTGGASLVSPMRTTVTIDG